MNGKVHKRGSFWWAKQCRSVTELTGQLCGPKFQSSHLKQLPFFTSIWITPYNDSYYPISNQRWILPSYVSFSAPITFPSVIWHIYLEFHSTTEKEKRKAFLHYLNFFVICLLKLPEISLTGDWAVLFWKYAYVNANQWITFFLSSYTSLRWFVVKTGKRMLNRNLRERTLRN